MKRFILLLFLFSFGLTFATESTTIKEKDVPIEHSVIFDFDSGIAFDFVNQKSAVQLKLFKPKKSNDFGLAIIFDSADFVLHNYRYQEKMNKNLRLQVIQEQAYLSPVLLIC